MAETKTLASDFGPRCVCGHWPEEHSIEGGCAGCDAAGQGLASIEHDYKPDATADGEEE